MIQALPANLYFFVSGTGRCSCSRSYLKPNRDPRCLDSRETVYTSGGECNSKDACKIICCEHQGADEWEYSGDSGYCSWTSYACTLL